MSMRTVVESVHCPLSGPSRILLLNLVQRKMDEARSLAEMPLNRLVLLLINSSLKPFIVIFLGMPTTTRLACG